jgi:hypothetical protein
MYNALVLDCLHHATTSSEIASLCSCDQLLCHWTKALSLCLSCSDAAVFEELLSKGA